MKIGQGKQLSNRFYPKYEARNALREFSAGKSLGGFEKSSADKAPWEKEKGFGIKGPRKAESSGGGPEIGGAAAPTYREGTNNAFSRKLYFLLMIWEILYPGRALSPVFQHRSHRSHRLTARKLPTCFTRSLPGRESEPINGFRLSVIPGGRSGKLLAVGSSARQRRESSALRRDPTAIREAASANNDGARRNHPP